MLLALWLLTPQAAAFAKRQKRIKPPQTTPAELLEYLGPDAVNSSLVAARPSPLGGYGVFAKTHIPKGAALARVPFRRCVTAAAAARDPKIGQNIRWLLRSRRDDGDTTIDKIAIAALLAHARFNADADHARDRWGTYVAALPWEEGFLATTLGTQVAELAGQGAAAYRLVASRTFGLAHHRVVAGDDEMASVLFRCLMVPFADLFNHPSPASLEASDDAFFAGHLPVEEACVNWHLESRDPGAVRRRCGVVTVELDDFVTVDAPSGTETPEGAELWCWYIGALPGEWDAAEERDFVERYGFHPFE